MLIAFRQYPLLPGTALLLAHGFGLRHAVDADHIAAIDAVTRQLMQTGKRPPGVGVSLSLRHSTSVILATIGIAWTTHSLHARFETFKAVGGTIGTLVSRTFLLVLAAMNLVILRDVRRRYRHVQRNETLGLKGGIWDAGSPA